MSLETMISYSSIISSEVEMMKTSVGCLSRDDGNMTTTAIHNCLVRTQESSIWRLQQEQQPQEVV
jgi:hypothetical protein